MSSWVFSRYSVLLPHPKDVHVSTLQLCVSVVPFQVSVGVPYDEWECSPGWAPPWDPELPGKALATHNSELESKGWKTMILFLFIFLKFIFFFLIYLFQSLILEAFWSLLRSLMMFLRPEISYRNLPLVYIN